MKRFAVETISTFRHVYFIECKEAEHAMDTVVMEEAESYFQKHLGEQIVSAREVSNAEMARLIAETEQPTMTLEKLETGDWIKNCVHVVDYSK